MLSAHQQPIRCVCFLCLYNSPNLFRVLCLQVGLHAAWPTFGQVQTADKNSTYKQEEKESASQDCRVQISPRQDSSSHRVRPHNGLRLEQIKCKIRNENYITLHKVQQKCRYFCRGMKQLSIRCCLSNVTYCTKVSFYKDLQFGERINQINDACLVKIVG